MSAPEEADGQCPTPALGHSDSAGPEGSFTEKEAALSHSQLFFHTSLQVTSKIALPV